MKIKAKIPFTYMYPAPEPVPAEIYWAKDTVTIPDGMVGVEFDDDVLNAVLGSGISPLTIIFNGERFENVPCEGGSCGPIGIYSGDDSKCWLDGEPGTYTIWVVCESKPTELSATLDDTSTEAATVLLFELEGDTVKEGENNLDIGETITRSVVALKGVVGATICDFVSGDGVGIDDGDLVYTDGWVETASVTLHNEGK